MAAGDGSLGFQPANVQLPSEAMVYAGLVYSAWPDQTSCVDRFQKPPDLEDRLDAAADTWPMGGVRPRLYNVTRSLMVAGSLAQPPQPRRSYSKDCLVDPSVIRQIDLDIPRTAGEKQELTACLGVARAVLLRHAAVDAELGYCQGMNAVAALIALAACSQEEAFFRFAALTLQLRGLWLPGFPLLESGFAHFEALASERPWFEHLVASHIGVELYLPQAWLGFFETWLPLSTRLFFLWRVEQTGFAGLLAMTLAVLDLKGPGIVKEDDACQIIAEIKGHGIDLVALQKYIDSWLPRAVAAISQPLRATSKRSGENRCRLFRLGHRVVDCSAKETLAGQREARARSGSFGKSLLRWAIIGHTHEEELPHSISLP